MKKEGKIMLYEKSHSKELDMDLFKNPTSEYRGAPFWAWNCKLEKDELLRQIEILKEMGFGGYHMHVRSGMATEYLSEEFMDLIRACVKKGKEEEMLSWLYDEDRWPSGFAGGLVTKNPEYRMKYLLITPTPYGKGNLLVAHSASGAGGRSENGDLVARFDIKLDEDGCLESYNVLKDGEAAQNKEWFVYLESPLLSSRFNNQTYVDTLSKDAIAEFIRLTYKGYKDALGDDFGKAAPAIFTDEPQFAEKGVLTSPFEEKDVRFPFTTDFDETYKAAYGESFIPHIPELVWNLPKNAPSVSRYRYHDHACERFAEAFCDQCGKWCEENGILLTGHMMQEPTLKSQTGAVGEAMRSYRNYQLPGIDMLHSYREYTTAKQCQSAVHQYGREGMMSELYGVTSWDLDFREHKMNGDWQAALGVTLRVPHLSLVSLEGEAKRDYPASINYQSPWYKEYSYIEDHFSRLNTVLTRGKPEVRIGVIHPIESYWLSFGAWKNNSLDCEQMDTNFTTFTKWMVTGCLDFDFICESLLPDLCPDAGNPLRVGEMSYDVIVVPELRTMRRTTYERLMRFAEMGGKLIIVGKAPELIDAVPSNEGNALAAVSENIGFNRKDVFTALAPYRYFTVYNSNYSVCTNYVSTLRSEGDTRYLFLAAANSPANNDLPDKKKIYVEINGKYAVNLLDTLTGETCAVKCSYVGNKTVFSAEVELHDSMLYKLDPCAEEEKINLAQNASSFVNLLPVFDAEYELDEPNVLLLDVAEYSFDGSDYEPAEYLLALDSKIRRTIGWPEISGRFAQPWCVPEDKSVHSLKLRFTFESDIEYSGAVLALEHVEKCEIVFNGTKVDNTPIGYYVDRSIKSVALGDIRIGTNVIEVTMPFGNRTSTENMFLLGNFGVNLRGAVRRICQLPERLAFSDITDQYLPHYGGKVTYKFDVSVDSDKLRVFVPQYRAACLKASVDGGEEKNISLAPYTAEFDVAPGDHTVSLSAYVSRQNAFGHIHNTDRVNTNTSPGSFRTSGYRFSYEYRVWEEGLISAPVVSVKK